MPLSDHERQLLAQIEEGLAAEQPVRAVLRARFVPARWQVGVAGAVFGLVAGCLLIYLGLRLAGAGPNSAFFSDTAVVLGVLGYVVVVLSCHAGVRAVLAGRRQHDLL